MKTKKILSLLLSVAMILTMFTAFTVSASAAPNNIHVAKNWSEVNNLITSAATNDTIDVSNIQGGKAESTIAVNKSIVIKANASTINDCITKLNFNITSGATLTLEKIYIENTELAQSIVAGEGNVILNDSQLTTSTAYGTTTSYNAPATIQISGDVWVYGSTLTANNYSSVVTGATVIDRDGEFTGKAGTAINAKNVTIKDANIQGGISFEPGVDGGDAVVSSGKISIYGSLLADYNPSTYIYGGQGKNGGNALVAANGVLMKGGSVIGGISTDTINGVSGSGIVSGGNIELIGTKVIDTSTNKTYFDTYVLPGKGGYIPGVTIKFTDNASENYRTRKLIMKTAMVKGVNRTSPNPATPYIVEMMKNDIAVIDGSIIGWYSDIPLFSGGYYKITNPFSTWGTFENAIPLNDTDIEMYSTPVTATAGIPAPTYTVTIPETVDFGAQKQALKKYKNVDADQYGNKINVSVPFTVSAQNVDNLFDDLGKEPKINVAVSFDGTLKNAADKIPYTVKNADSTTFTSGNVFCSFKNSSELKSGETNTASGSVWINRADITKTASYQGTMTFTISIPNKK